MESDLESRKARAAARRATWSIERGTLTAPPAERITTPEERLGMMWQLTCDAWALSGRPFPAYRREDAPGRLFRTSRNER